MSAAAVSAAAVSAAVAAAVVIAGCAAGAAGTRDRYPEEKRPEPARSASDDEVLGASEQDPADTLEGSLTNLHPAPRSPHAELPANEAAHERLDHEQCEESNQALIAEAPAGTRKKPVCPPPPPEKEKDRGTMPVPDR